ncbi:MAG: hypothetical protein DBX66_07780 [Clostridiales bacterium]|uniref:Uncharacterized protein n=1 Tax=Harryflintia acetispora TaxID=1849041 RepID=A0A9X8Y8W3_9FIRM|nr:hypothetical protein [Harryflintia acetispora]PWM35887.1 MAG: hypothetical protein DBX66_07780 [Clostridiales bacterium]RGB66326.1 hypothetical protein DW086_09110 [Harryflintia acetispora]TCL44126.1 hypothetical protein EDD78_103164 [Harryflintia acetispora]
MDGKEAILVPRVKRNAPVSLQSLLQQCPGARAYYNTLPEHIRQLVARNGERIQTVAKLERYAQNLLEADGISGL